LRRSRTVRVMYVRVGIRIGIRLLGGYLRLLGGYLRLLGGYLRLLGGYGRLLDSHGSAARE
jgi:hypothetical protein